MEDILPLLKYFLPLLIPLGGWLAVRCIGKLARIVSPKTRSLFSAQDNNVRLTLPETGRYVVSVLIPPSKILIGVSHFSADFALTSRHSGEGIAYFPRNRLNLLTVRRTDMRGNQSLQIGTFQCEEPGEYEITCITPELIRPEYRIEITPYVSPLRLFILIPGLILGAAMTIGGIIASSILLT
ncbi:hypothetical protein SOASR030_26200 [Leminorella grimontii]|uniref:DUF3592 domain-containing protein n=1 Tax=Leminorella grimontii TaxID=82981 RepID=A0AAV5N4X2_9GAMM|nr:hypothetical protein [Leminorella grimontii]KFC94766.1 hypothetical protein GLGR_2527 [Leminorella grimontii ATCC 33999 = DSM 5078]GKX56508.1 hypothetical protein SOASR030_26200 [Leminorella grimontii]VFS61496.1 Uncharacterised protein [Leminorella grimontii]